MHDEGELTPTKGEHEAAPSSGVEGESSIAENENELTTNSSGDESVLTSGRSMPRRFVTMLVITAVAAIATGHVLRQPAFMTANDISRWCTVWSLLERGTYAIDDCPWQIDTQDKIYRAPGKRGGDAQGQPEVKHYYSSKPALISTLIAGMLYPARRLTRVPLDRVLVQERAERWTQKPDPVHPGKLIGVLEKPKDPAKWPVYNYYFKPVLIVCNVIPFCLFLVFFARTLDRYTTNDWSWYFSLTAAAFGTYLLPYTQTLNNHTIGAFSAFFALYHFLRIWDEGVVSGWRFAAMGFFAGFTASTELPALSFPALLGAMVLVRFPLRTILCFLPAAMIPIAALVAGQFIVFGEFYIPYESFGSDEYRYEGSLWQTPLELDAFNEHPEPYWVYLFHMTFGHHGIFSLTPLFLFSAWGGIRLLGGGRLLTLWTCLTLVTTFGLGGYYLRDPSAWAPEGRLWPYAWVLLSIPLLLGGLAMLAAIPWLRGTDRPMEAMAWMTAVLTAVIVGFYTWTPKARNYGGSAQGLRWIMWLIPFWLLLLPKAVEEGQVRARLRRLALLALAISALSVGYAMRNPWSSPWILDAMEQLGLYPLKH
jgi:hypothetical protein